MISLFTTTPKFCPQCGTPRDNFDRDLCRQDFFAGASCTCKCGCHYAYASGVELLKAAEASGGDLQRYVDANGDSVR